MAKYALGAIRPCAKCGIEKPFTINFFRPYTNGERSSLRSTCRACQGYREGGDRKDWNRLTPEERVTRKSYYNRRWREKDPERARLIWNAGAERNRTQRRAACALRWANRDPEEARRKYATWKAVNAERVREYARAYQPGYRERNREQGRAKTRRWRARNPDKAKVSGRLYRARKAGAQGSHTLADVIAILRAQRRLCFYCSTSLTSYHVDHFIPLSRGGSDFPENLRLACSSCNCRKSNKLPWEWMPERFHAP